MYVQPGSERVSLIIDIRSFTPTLSSCCRSGGSQSLDCAKTPPSLQRIRPFTTPVFVQLVFFIHNLDRTIVRHPLRSLVRCARPGEAPSHLPPFTFDMMLSSSIIIPFFTVTSPHLSTTLLLPRSVSGCPFPLSHTLAPASSMHSLTLVIDSTLTSHLPRSLDLKSSAVHDCLSSNSIKRLSSFKTSSG